MISIGICVLCVCLRLYLCVCICACACVCTCAYDIPHPKPTCVWTPLTMYLCVTQPVFLALLTRQDNHSPGGYFITNLVDSS